MAGGLRPHAEGPPEELKGAPDLGRRGHALWRGDRGWRVSDNECVLGLLDSSINRFDHPRLYKLGNLHVSQLQLT